MLKGFSIASVQAIARPLRADHPAIERRGSSVVERIIGNDEVGSSILPRGTSLPSGLYDGFPTGLYRVDSTLKPCDIIDSPHVLKSRYQHKALLSRSKIL